MDTTREPIAVFDSGMGGISVLRELVRMMPNENYLYFGDSANAPYGAKSTQEVCALTMAHAARLLAEPAKALVLACNTATAAAVDRLRQTYPNIPIIGIEPALKPAATSRPHAKVLVLATEVTLHEEKFHHLAERYSNTAKIVSLPAPGLVEFVERGMLGGPQVLAYLHALLAPYRQIHFDCVVLGCTHFPFVRGSVCQALGYDVEIYDGGVGTARETLHQLQTHGLRNPDDGKGCVALRNSLHTPQMAALAERLLYE